MNWMQHPIVLEGPRVKLVPLEHAHFAELLAIGKEERIWELMSINGADEAVLAQHMKAAILKRSTGEQYPFTAIDKATGKIFGSTMFHNIYPEHRKLEIGWTWNDPAYWRTGYNRECKLLLLTHAFEVLKAIRVQLQTDVNNSRSKNAIEGIGAQFEGILRNDRVRANGAYRNTAVYSIIEAEWPEVKTMLTAKIARYDAFSG